MKNDLSGITLLDLGGMGPAARCVRVLADLGARWIRLTPPSSADRHPLPWHSYGAFRGAEQIEFDLKQPEAREVFLRLAKGADIIVEGFRPGVVDRLGIGYRDVSAVNKRIVYCAATGYGQDGPYAQHVGHDINYQAWAGGLAYAGRGPEGVPALPGMSLADSAGGGWQGALRILSALVARQSTGEGKYVDVAAAEGVMHLMSVVIDEQLGTGQPPDRSGVIYGTYACYGIYATADGKAMAVGAVEPKFFANVCAVLGLPELAKLQYQKDAQPEIRKAMVAAFKTLTRAQWAQRFEGVEACVTPVMATEELESDPHWQARGMFCEYQHPDEGRKRQVAPFGRGDPSARGAAPSAAKYICNEVLESFGFARTEVENLKSKGVVR